jgi:hypothetical protein
VHISYLLGLLLDSLANFSQERRARVTPCSYRQMSRAQISYDRDLPVSLGSKDDVRVNDQRADTEKNFERPPTQDSAIGTVKKD